MSLNSFSEGAWALILAAGTGSRMAGAISCPKQFLEWQGLPLYYHSVLTFSRCAHVRGLVLVFPPDLCAREAGRMKELAAVASPGLPWKIAPGGSSRRESAANGLALVPPTIPHVLVHDAARPFFTPQLVSRLFGRLDACCSGVIPALAPKDTIKLARDGLVEQTLPRHRLVAVQTPQLFKADFLRMANERAAGNRDLTDDASLVEKAGGEVRICEGEAANIKITTPEDLRLLNAEDFIWLPCNGFGYDAHRFGPGRPLKLGGVNIPCDTGVLAHSDGDVLLHALIDALLGAAALGDIGKLFPASDPTYEGISSALLLDRVYTLFRDAGLVLTHVDLTIIAQKPCLEPWKNEIARNVARLLALDSPQVAVKATTEEGLGFTGRLEGIKACALASAVRKMDRRKFQGQ